jgi:hypothetical protein
VVNRKDFTPSEAVAIGKRIEEAYRPKAEKAMAEGQKAGGNIGGRGRQNSSGADCPRAIRDDSKRTAAVAAAAAGMSRKTYEKAKKVVDAAVRQPDLFGPVDAETQATLSHHQRRSLSGLRCLDAVPLGRHSTDIAISNVVVLIPEGHFGRRGRRRAGVSLVPPKTL